MFGPVRDPRALIAPGCFVAALIALAACSGNTNPYTNFQPIHQPTARPTATASSAPSTAPTASAAPTATPSAGVPTPTPSPSPAATPSPSPSPSPSAGLIVLSPTAGAVGNNGGCPPTGPASYTFTATETGYTGMFTWTQQSGSAKQFSVSPVSVSNGGTFTVTDANPSVATGVWSITVMDSFGNTATESVTSVICLL